MDYIEMIRILAFFILLLVFLPTFAAIDGYAVPNNQQAAIDLCNSSKPSGASCSFGSSQCIAGTICNSCTNYVSTYTVSVPTYSTHEFVSCIGGIMTCPAGQERIYPSGQCAATCPSAGVTKVIGVQNLAGKSTNTGGELVIRIDEDSTATHTVISDGCQYSYGSGDFAGKCYTSVSATAVNGEKPVTCEYTATSLGTRTSSTNTAIDPATSKPTDAVNTPNPEADCVTDSKGNTVCRSNSEANKKCGTVNGVKVCVDTTTGTGTVNGQPYTPSDKNCGFVQGKPVCVSTTGSGEIASTQGCLKNGSVVHCVNSDIKTETVEGPTVANPDGTTTKTKTTESNEIGSTPEVSTTTTGTDGTTTTITTGGSGSGKGNGDRDIKTDCDKYPDSIGCQTLKEASGNEGGALTTESMDIGINANSSWGSGSCPAPKQLNLQTVVGKSWSYQPVCDFMGYMRPVLIAFGWLIGAFIVLS